MSYSLFDKDEHWHKPEQAFLTDDHRTILRFAVEALMSGKGAVLVTLVEIRGGAAPARGADGGARRWPLLRFCLWRLRGGRCRFEALEVMGSGRDREICYGEGSPWFDIVLPCGGGITLTLHKLRSAQPLLAVLNRRNRENRRVCATIRKLNRWCACPRKPGRAGISMALRWGSGHASV
ncbi:hypothetical protein ECZU17_31650 [Escherichia coli]|nr:hypothetical protein ECZU17_31650 [Escherichia coli]